MEHKPRYAHKCPECGSTTDVHINRNHHREYYDKKQKICFELKCHSKKCRGNLRGETYWVDPYSFYNNLSHLIEKDDKYPRSNDKGMILCGFIKDRNS